MPSFGVEVTNLEDVGPVVGVRAAVGTRLERRLQARNRPVPVPTELLAMIDTGASATVICTGVADSLGLEPVGVTFISTASSKAVECNKYRVRLHLPNDVSFETTVVEAPLDGQHIQCLIGRDVLAQAVVVYIGYASLFSVSF